jgi:two-component system, chemotaxis family, protein-glutamate methylesterase/glutaminase
VRTLAYIERYTQAVTDGSVVGDVFEDDVPDRAAAPDVGRSAVVLAGSIGGLEAMRTVLQGLPRQFPCPVVLILHRAARSGRPDMVPYVLGLRTALPVQTLDPTAPLQAGVHVLAPGTALTTRPGSMLDVELTDTLCTADRTMTSVAEHYGARSIGVVVSGSMSDGARGARAIKRAGGRVVVQEPSDARVPGMPAAVLATGSVDLVVPLRRIAQTLVALTMAPGGADLLRTPRAPWAS